MSGARVLGVARAWTHTHLRLRPIAAGAIGDTPLSSSLPPSSLLLDAAAVVPIVARFAAAIPGAVPRVLPPLAVGFGGHIHGHCPVQVSEKSSGRPLLT